MCDISKETELKNVTVYKMMYKDHDHSFTSPFAYAIIQEGDVGDLRSSEYLEGQSLYNANIIGRVSGFEFLSDAIKLMLCKSDCPVTIYSHNKSRNTILEIVLEPTNRGPIMEGTIQGISNVFGKCNENRTFAGSFVRSIRELDAKDIKKEYNRYRQLNKFRD